MSSKSNQGNVVSINIAEEEGGVIRSLKEVELASGHGIVGDRNYFKEDKKPEQELTLIELVRPSRSATQALKALNCVRPASM